METKVLSRTPQESLSETYMFILHVLVLIRMSFRIKFICFSLFSWSIIQSLLQLSYLFDSVVPDQLVPIFQQSWSENWHPWNIKHDNWLQNTKVKLIFINYLLQSWSWGPVFKVNFFVADNIPLLPMISKYLSNS